MNERTDVTLELARLSRELRDNGYASANLAKSLASASVVRSPHWLSFSQSWFRLPQDTYMADQGKYRSRRYSQFSIEPRVGKMSLLPHRPFRQTKAVNYLNGGIDRLFAPIEGETINNEAFRAALIGCASLLESLESADSWHAQVFQNRIAAHPEYSGHPTPEGVHRDGVDYVFTMLSQRYNVVGGESSTYIAGSQIPAATQTLEAPGDFILTDDIRTQHGVTPIRCADNVSAGYRDVLVVMYSARHESQRPA
jgi:hypothetical protein